METVVRIRTAPGETLELRSAGSEGPWLLVQCQPGGEEQTLNRYASVGDFDEEARAWLRGGVLQPEEEA